MPIHYEKNPTGTDEHLVLITIDRPEAKNALDMYHFRDLAGAWKQFRYDDDAWVAIVTGVERNFMAGADLKTYIPQITELAEADQHRRGHRGRRLPLDRRHARRAARHEDLQADRRRDQRSVCGGRHGDARRHRHPHRHDERQVRRDGAEARVCSPVVARPLGCPGSWRSRPRWSSCSPPRRSRPSVRSSWGC